MMLTGCPDNKLADAVTLHDLVGDYTGDAVAIINYADAPSAPDTLRCDSIALVRVKAETSDEPKAVFADFVASDNDASPDTASGWSVECGRFVVTGNSTLRSDPGPRRQYASICTPRFGWVLASPYKGAKMPAGMVTYEEGNLHLYVTDTLDCVNRAGDSIPLTTVRYEFRGTKVN